MSFLLLLKNSFNTKHPYALNFHQQFSLIFLPCISELVEPETNPSSDIGKVDTQVINEYVSSTKEASSRSTKYRKWTDKNRYDIGKYAAKNGNINAVRKFQTSKKVLFEYLRSNTTKNYEKERKKSNCPKRFKSIDKRRRPFLLGDLDEMVQQHLRFLSKKGSVINTTVANANARALIRKYPHVAGDVDVESSRWAKSLFARMNFVRRRKISSQVEIPENAWKEIELLFLHEIVSKVEKYKIPSELIINIDQKPLKSITTLAPRGETSVTV